MQQRFLVPVTVVAVLLFSFSLLQREALPGYLSSRVTPEAQGQPSMSTLSGETAAPLDLGSVLPSQGPHPLETPTYPGKPSPFPAQPPPDLIGTGNVGLGLLGWLPPWLPYRLTPGSGQSDDDGSWLGIVFQTGHTWKPITTGKLYYLPAMQLSSTRAVANTKEMSAEGYMLICAPDYDSKPSSRTITVDSGSAHVGGQFEGEALNRYRRWVEEKVGPDAFKVVVYNDQMRAAGSVRRLSKKTFEEVGVEEGKVKELRKLYQLCHSSRSLESDTTDSAADGFRLYPYLVRFPVWMPEEAGSGGGKDGAAMPLKVDIKWDLDHYRSLQEKDSTVSIFKNKYIARGSTISLSRRPEVSQVFGGRSRTECNREMLQRGSGVFIKTVKEKDLQLQYYPWTGSEWQYTMQECAVVQYSRRPKLLFQCLRQRVVTTQQAAGKTSGQLKILFTGDSQVRTLYRHWVAVLSNTRAVQAKGGNLTFTLRIPPSTTAGVTDTEQGTDKGAGQYSTTADYLWDPYLEGLVNGTTFPGGSIPYDVVVIGIGAWPSSFGQWTMAKFDAHIQKVARKLKELSQGRPTPVELIWAGSPAWPKPRQMPGFRITNYRLATMNAVGAHRLEMELQEGKQQPTLRKAKAGEEVEPQVRVSLLVLDWFWVSLPWAHLHRGDGMHYDHSLVLYTAASLLGNLLCAPT